MNYEIFTLLENGTLAKAEHESEQDFMTRVLSDVFAGQEAGLSERINNKMAPVFAYCSAKDRSLSVSFVAEEWMLNPNGTLHGGIMNTAADMVMCVLGRYLAKKRTLVTVQLSINFLRSIQKGDTFTVHAAADHVGRRSTVMHAQITTDHSDKPAATASAVLM